MNINKNLKSIIRVKSIGYAQMCTSIFFTKTCKVKTKKSM